MAELEHETGSEEKRMRTEDKEESSPSGLNGRDRLGDVDMEPGGGNNATEPEIRADGSAERTEEQVWREYDGGGPRGEQDQAGAGGEGAGHDEAEAGVRQHQPPATQGGEHGPAREEEAAGAPSSPRGGGGALPVPGLGLSQLRTPARTKAAHLLPVLRILSSQSVRMWHITIAMVLSVSLSIWRFSLSS